MKKLLSLSLWLTLLNMSLSAHANSFICSQLQNNTYLPFHYDIGKSGFHLNKGNTSPIIGFEDAYRYRLLDGTVSVDEGGVRITKNGRFSILTENIKVSAKHHCKVAYLIHIYD